MIKGLIRVCVVSIAEAIGKLGDKEVVPGLVEMLGDEGINHRCAL